MVKRDGASRLSVKWLVYGQSVMLAYCLDSGIKGAAATRQSSFSGQSDVLPPTEMT